MVTIYKWLPLYINDVHYLLIIPLCYIYSTVGRSIADIYEPRQHIYRGAKWCHFCCRRKCRMGKMADTWLRATWPLLAADSALSLHLLRFYPRVQTKWHAVGATDQGLVPTVNVWKTTKSAQIVSQDLNDTPIDMIVSEGCLWTHFFFQWQLHLTPWTM